MRASQPTQENGVLAEFALPAGPFIPPLHCSSLQAPSKHPQSPPKPDQKNLSSYIPGCARKLCWASKSEDIYPKLLNARNQVRLIAIPSPASQGLGIIPPAAWESRKPGCTKLLWTLFVPNSSSGLLLFVFQLCYLV